MSSLEQFSGVVSSEEAEGVFGRENVAMKHLTGVNGEDSESVSCANLQRQSNLLGERGSRFCVHGSARIKRLRR